MGNEVKMFQIWKKVYPDGTYVLMQILGVDNKHILSIVIESNNKDRSVGWIGPMCLQGSDISGFKQNRFGWVLQSEDKILCQICNPGFDKISYSHGMLDVSLKKFKLGDKVMVREGQRDLTGTIKSNGVTGVTYQVHIDGDKSLGYYNESDISKHEH